MSVNFHRPGSAADINCPRIAVNRCPLGSVNRCPLGSVQCPRIRGPVGLRGASRAVARLVSLFNSKQRKGPRNGGPDRRCGAAGALHMVNRDSNVTVADHVLHFVADRVGSAAGVF